ncbi:DNA-entry nuclease [Paenibacillus paeoniae]|uniref:DNA-entry nuclease n=1 Tax=Paenibacillus paeoniae TaxID=2292705 RepID=A0A371PJ94_9BACL|nr:DNA-entry nuclease [Paenibacillus paeoniae]
MKKIIIFSFLILVLLTACGEYEIRTVQSTEYDYELIFPSDKYPETALHIHGAIAQGYSSICTIDRGGAESNRKKSLAGIDTKNGYDRDEWPMAMCEEGGKGASVAYIDSSDNRGAGSWVGHQLSDYPNGAKVLFVVDKPKVLFPNHPVTANPSDAPAATPITKKLPNEDAKEEVVYANCAAVRAAGKAPLHKGEPGYSKKLDRDGDGVACQ